jgi:hypothetical protein
MKLGRILQAAMIVGAGFLLVSTASASSINFTTAVTSPYVTAFVSGGTIVNGGLTLDNSSAVGGASATLRFAGVTTTGLGTPTNTALGDFFIVCNSCSTASANTADATFSAFVFDMYIYDSTDGGYAEFIGNSVGGTVYSNQSNITINWTPAQLGPGTTHVVSGTLGSTYFTAPASTPIVAPSTGGGDTSVQGFVGSTVSPEPATMAMVGGLFIGLAGLARKRRKA